mgnify:CR=1 FL=1
MESKKSKTAGFMVRFLSLVLIASFFFGSQAVFAEGTSTSAIDETFNVATHLITPGQGTSTVSAESGGIANFIVKVIGFLVKIIGSVALVVFILGALLTMSSEGKQDRLEKGKTAMLYALIGLIIAFFSFIIVTFVQSIFF